VSFACTMFAGHVILGAGLLAVVVALATLLFGFGSGVEELNTVAVLPMIVPFATEQFTWATIVIMAVVPGGIDANVIVRVWPDPPHTPPPVESHETKVVLAERTSITETEVAVAGPALVTTIVLVTWDPVSTGFGAMLVITDRSAGVPPDWPPTWMALENSDVLFEGLVAVAVITCPGGTVTAKVGLKLASPAPLVFTIAEPMKF